MLNKYSEPLKPRPIAASAVFEIVLDMRNVKYKRLLIIQEWPNGTGAAPNGLELSILPGFGPANNSFDLVELAKLKFATLDPNVVYQPTLAQPGPNLAAGPGNEFSTFLSLDWENNSRFPKLRFENLDAAQGLILTIWGDE